MILSNKPTNPGDLRTPVTLYKRAVSTGAGGFPRGSKGDKIAEVLASWENTHRDDVWGAAALNAVDTATVLIRYNASLDTTCLLEKGGRLYEIISTDDIKERHEYMELTVKRVTEG